MWSWGLAMCRASALNVWTTGKHMLTRIYVSIKCAEGVPSCTLNDLSDRRVWGLMCSDPCPFRPAHIRTQIIFNGAWGSIVL